MPAPTNPHGSDRSGSEPCDLCESAFLVVLWSLRRIPDDEVLGAGGLLQCMRRLGVEIAIVAVTDGEGSHPASAARGVDIASMRAQESMAALDRLGCESTSVTRLGLPDGGVANEMPRLTCAPLTTLDPLTSVSPRGGATATPIMMRPAWPRSLRPAPPIRRSSNTSCGRGTGHRPGTARRPVAPLSST